LIQVNVVLRFMGQQESMKTAAAAFILILSLAHAAAAPQQFTCVLTNPAGQSPSQSLNVIYDDAAKTLQAQSGQSTYSFDNVSISTIAIAGYTGPVSLGIDRSSLGVVWQQYSDGKVTTEFGQCRPNPAPATSP
jgi:hypothetical protein